MRDRETGALSSIYPRRGEVGLRVSPLHGINEADRFSIAATCKPLLHHAVTDPSTKKEIACIQ